MVAVVKDDVVDSVVDELIEVIVVFLDVLEMAVE